MINKNMAPTKKKVTRTTKRKTIKQNLTTITTNTTLSAIENDDDNEIQTIQNRESKYQTEKHSKEQVECNNSTFPSSNMVSNQSNKNSMTEPINNNNTGIMRQKIHSRNQVE